MFLKNLLPHQCNDKAATSFPTNAKTVTASLRVSDRQIQIVAMC